MHLHLLSLLPLLCLSADVPAKKVCSLQDVVDHLNLTGNRERLTMTRPVLDWTKPTVVYMDTFVYAILSVHEKSQTFIPYIWISSYWENEMISWNPADFCGIQQVIIPLESLWKPDLIIFERMEKEEASSSPYLIVRHDGKVIMDSNVKVVSTCVMDVHKFPFDTQKCNLTFSSAIYSDEEIQLVPMSNSSSLTKTSQEVMLTRGEWEFLNVSVHAAKMILEGQQSWDKVTYTITIKRVPLLHLLTFIIPILFFLTLDLASFFISDRRGDKLCFKVTVLLAMSVLLLILTDTLPAKPSKTPLMAVYVIVVFAFILLSVLETILMVYLMERDSTTQCGGVSTARGLSTEELCHSSSTTGKRKPAAGGRVCGANGVHQLETLPAVEPPEPHEGAEGQSITHLLRLILQELQTGAQNVSQDRERVRNQNAVTWPIHIAFYLFYLLSISVFLLFLFLNWISW